MPKTIEHQSPIHEPLRPDAVLALKRAELSPRALTYAESIEKQIQNIFSSHNISSIEEFESVAKQKGVFSQDEIEKLQELLELLREIADKGEIPTSATIIRVESRAKNIVNPFGEVYKDNGVSDIENLEEFEIDLAEILETCKETYRKKGIDTWVKELPSNIADIISGDPKQQKRFEAYLKEGRIPIFMPPKSVQLETMKDMLYDAENGTYFKHFKPDVVKNGISNPAEDGYVGWDYFKQLMENKDSSLVTDVPDTWYIMWVKPRQKPEATSKYIEDQKKYILKKQAKFKRQHNVTQSLIYGMMPAEYLALQIVFPDILGAQAQKDNVNIQTLQPLDNNTYTCFPGVKKDERGDVAGAHWIVFSLKFDMYGNIAGVGGAGELVGTRLVIREIKINS